MRCLYCMRELSPAASFCPYCGKSQQPPNAQPGRPADAGAPNDGVNPPTMAMRAEEPYHRHRPDDNGSGMPPQPPSRKPIVILSIAIAVLVVVVGVLVTVLLLNRKEPDKKPETSVAAATTTAATGASQPSSIAESTTKPTQPSGAEQTPTPSQQSTPPVQQVPSPQQTPSPQQISPPQTPEPQPEENPADNVFQAFAGRQFLMGASHTSTYLTVNEDGSFSGDYRQHLAIRRDNYPSGTDKLSTFTGRFTNVTPIDRYSYSMTVTDLTVTSDTGAETIQNGTLMQYVDYTGGFSNGATVTLYTPDMPLSEAVSRLGLTGGNGSYRSGKMAIAPPGDVLSCYCIAGEVKYWLMLY